MFWELYEKKLVAEEKLKDLMSQKHKFKPIEMKKRNMSEFQEYQRGYDTVAQMTEEIKQLEREIEGKK